MTSKVYIMENLDCANCASKIERKIASLPGVQEVSITFSTRQLRLTAENPDTLLPEIQKIANSLEPDIIITERKRRVSKHNAAALTHESCSCEHDHEEHPHEHQHHHESCDCLMSINIITKAATADTITRNILMNTIPPPKICLRTQKQSSP